MHMHKASYNNKDNIQLHVCTVQHTEYIAKGSIWQPYMEGEIFIDSSKEHVCRHRHIAHTHMYAYTQRQIQTHTHTHTHTLRHTYTAMLHT